MIICVYEYNCWPTGEKYVDVLLKRKFGGHPSMGPFRDLGAEEYALVT
jgi:hypothetical protein